jgi:Tol biopolymer transport system component/DNA-binding winged helix-turn-helix (wHTH) protein
LGQTARNQPDRLRFGPFEVDRVEGRLYKRGVLLRIENHPLLVLIALLERPDEIVSREELQQRIWGQGINVGFEDGLNTAVRKLRFVLGDSADAPMFIETIPKKGYRFVASLNSVEAEVPVGTEEISENIEDENIHLVADSIRETAVVPTEESKRYIFSSWLRLIAILLLLAFVAAAFLFWRQWRVRRVFAEFPTIQARRLEGAHTHEAVALSPDGRYVAYAAWDGQMSSLRLRQLANAGDVEILAPRKTNYVGLTFSPDGNEIYFVSNNEDNPHYRSLYRMPALGGQTQKLMEDIDSPISFSPDGKRFVYARFRAASSTLELRTANADGSGEELFTQLAGYAWGCFLPRAAWSPDGGTIAIPFRSTTRAGRSSIYTIDTTTKQTTEVYSASGCLGHPAWASNDTLLVSRAGELWMVNAKEKTSEVRHLAGYGGSLGEQIDISSDGKFAVATGDQLNTGLWFVTASSNGTQAVRAKQLISGDASVSVVDEMNDGHLLITKNDGSIWMTKSDGADWRRLANINGFAISCGQYVVVLTENHSLARISPDRTNAKTLVDGPVKSPTCSLQGDAVYYATTSSPQQIMRVPIEGGDSSLVTKIEEGVLVALRVSPDGNSLAYTFYQGSEPNSRFSVSVLRASDGVTTSTINDAKSGAWQFYWSPDGKALDYLSSQDAFADVWEQPLAGGTPRRLTNFGSGEVNEFHWSRDGERLLVAWGPTRDDVVLLTEVQ